MHSNMRQAGLYVMGDNLHGGSSGVVREAPWMSHLSEQARTCLRQVHTPWVLPEIHDTEAWLTLIGDLDAQAEADMTAVAADMSVHSRRVGEVDIYVASTRDSADLESGPVYLNFHGGALICGGGKLVGFSACIEASALGLPTWSVDYRMPPRHPYPAAVEDGLTAYRALLQSRDPREIVVGGGSAGGNVATATMLRAKEADLPMPAAMVLLTPEVDLTESGDSFTTLADQDPTLRSLRGVNELYAAGRPLDDPGVSPLFGDLAGLPPVFLQSGTRDLFLSNAVRLHRRLLDLGVEAELHIFEGRPHSGFWGTPEDEEVDIAVRRFIALHLGSNFDDERAQATRQ